MFAFQTLIVFGTLLIFFSQGEDMWMLVVKPKPRTHSGHNVPSTLLWALSTPTRLSCAALCLRKDGCLFYRYQDHVCHGYISSRTTTPPSDIATITQGYFRRYKRKTVRGGYKRLSFFGTTLYVKGHTYLRNREEALQVCQAEGGTLIKLDSKLKVILLKREFRHTFGGKDYIWIGLSDRCDNDTWYWTDGTALGHYSNWDSEEPQNVHDGVAENCAQIRISTDWKWIDVPCRCKDKFVCERV